MFIDFQTTSKSMTLSKLPLWQTPEQVCDILLALPEKQRNRALYELVFLFDHENPQGRPKVSLPPCACCGMTRVFKVWKTSDIGCAMCLGWTSQTVHGLRCRAKSKR